MAIKGQNFVIFSNCLCQMITLWCKVYFKKRKSTKTYENSDVETKNAENGGHLGFSIFPHNYFTFWPISNFFAILSSESAAL